MQVPSEIDATGNTNVTVPLNAFLTSLTKGTTVDFPPLAKYRCEDTIVLGGKTGITLNGLTIFATTKGLRERAHLRIASCRDITLTHPNVIGANPYSGLDDAAYNPKTEAQHGIEILSCVGVTVDHPEIRSVFGDFIYLGRRTAKTIWSSWIHVISPFGRDNGRIGVSFIAAALVKIEDVDFGRMRRSVFDFEPDSVSGGAYQVLIDGGTVGRSHTGFLVASHGKPGLVSDIAVRNVYLPNSYVSADVASPAGTRCRKNFSIVDCISAERAERTPMTFTRVDGLTVRGNTQPLLSGVDLLETNDCTGVTTR